MDSRGLVESGKLLSVAVSIEDGVKSCEYGIWVTFADGSRIEDNDVDLCKLGSYSVHD